MSDADACFHKPVDSNFIFSPVGKRHIPSSLSTKDRESCFVSFSNDVKAFHPHTFASALTCTTDLVMKQQARDTIQLLFPQPHSTQGHTPSRIVSFREKTRVDHNNSPSNGPFFWRQLFSSWPRQTFSHVPISQPRHDLVIYRHTNNAYKDVENDYSLRTGLCGIFWVLVRQRFIDNFLLNQPDLGLFDDECHPSLYRIF